MVHRFVSAPATRRGYRPRSGPPCAERTLLRALALGVVLLLPWGATAVEWTPVADRPHSPFFVNAVVAVTDDGVVFESHADGVRGLHEWRSDAEVELLAMIDDRLVQGSSPPLFADGQVFWRATGPHAATFAQSVFLDDCAVDRSGDGLFRWLPGAGVSLVAQPGQAVAGLGPGWRYNSDGSTNESPIGGRIAVGPGGNVAFVAKLRFGDLCGLDPLAPVAFALFGPDGLGGVELVAVEGDEIPEITDTPGPVWHSFSTLRLDDDGRLLVNAWLRLGPSGPFASAIFRWKASSGLELIAREGEAPDGTRLGQLFLISSPGGRIAFADAATGVYDVVEGEEPTLRLALGDPAPGAPPGWVFQAIGTVRWGVPAPLMNDTGQLAFSAVAGLPGTFERLEGVWSPDAAGVSRLRLWGGQPAPFVADAEIASLAVLAIAASGRTLVRAELRTTQHYPGVVAYYAIEPSGVIRLLIHEGEPLEFDPGAPVESMSLRIAHDRALERIALSAVSGYGDETGLFVTTLPEADGMAAVAVAFAALLALRVARTRGPGATPHEASRPGRASAPLRRRHHATRKRTRLPPGRRFASGHSDLPVYREPELTAPQRQSHGDGRRPGAPSAPPADRSGQTVRHPGTHWAPSPCACVLAQGVELGIEELVSGGDSGVEGDTEGDSHASRNRTIPNGALAGHRDGTSSPSPDRAASRKLGKSSQL